MGCAPPSSTVGCFYYSKVHHQRWGVNFNFLEGSLCFDWRLPFADLWFHLTIHFLPIQSDVWLGKWGENAHRTQTTNIPFGIRFLKSSGFVFNVMYIFCKWGTRWSWECSMFTDNSRSGESKRVASQLLFLSSGTASLRRRCTILVQALARAEEAHKGWDAYQGLEISPKTCVACDEADGGTTEQGPTTHIWTCTIF